MQLFVCNFLQLDELLFIWGSAPLIEWGSFVEKAAKLDCWGPSGDVELTLQLFFIFVYLFIYFLLQFFLYFNQCTENILYQSTTAWTLEQFKSLSYQTFTEIKSDWMICENNGKFTGETCFLWQNVKNIVIKLCNRLIWFIQLFAHGLDQNH